MQIHCRHIQRSIASQRLDPVSSFSKYRPNVRPSVLVRHASAAQAMSPPSLKLIYFGIPGKAELSRILLNYAGVPFEDYIIKKEEWADLKTKMPFGQVPVLEIDGKMLAQSSAIERYAANLAGLVPSDPLTAARGDETIAFVNEFGDVFRPSFGIQDPEAKLKMRQEIVAGPLREKLLKLAITLNAAAAAGNEFITGDKPALVDLAVFNALSLLVCGFLDGVPKTLFDDYPELKAFHNKVAALPPIAKMYGSVTEGMTLAFKPL